MIKFEIMLSYSTEGPNRKKVEGLFKSFQEDMVDCLGEPKLHGTMLHIIDIEPPAKSKESPQTAKRSTERSTTNSQSDKIRPHCFHCRKRKKGCIYTCGNHCCFKAFKHV